MLSGTMQGTIAALAFLAICTAAPASAAGDAERGRQVFSKCVQCHIADSERNRLGPHLKGIVGRPMGSVESYRSYSAALKDAHASGRVWDEETLAAFIASPRKTIPGNSMRFFGLWSEEDITDLIAYLKSLQQQP